MVLKDRKMAKLKIDQKFKNQKKLKNLEQDTTFGIYRPTKTTKLGILLFFQYR